MDQQQQAQIPLSVYSSSSQEILSGSGSNSPAFRVKPEPETTQHSTSESACLLAGEKPRQIPELYELKESENDADDEDLYQSRNTLKPIKLLAELKNDMSSFSRERPYKKKALEGTLVRKHFGGSGTTPTESQLSLKNPVFKFNTLQFRPSAVNNQPHNNPFGYNTISNGTRRSVESASARVQVNTSTFLTGTPKKEPVVEANEATGNRDDSLNIEDNCQGNITCSFVF